MKRIILIVLAVAAVAALVPGASKAEPKNQWPFTRPVAAHARSLAANEVGHGASRYLIGQGEAKNEAPFTTVVVTRSSGGGTDWIELTLGGIALVLVAGVALGIVQLSRHAAAKPVA